jgi:hypothetical protein
LTFPRVFAIFGHEPARVSGPGQGWSMLPLTVDDLLPLEEYASRRGEFFDSHRRYVDRCRRVRVGPKLTLIFENRQTLWYRIQEVIRIARLADRREVQQELNLYNRLLPGRDRLQAALLIEVNAEQFTEEMAPWRNLAGEQLVLHAAGQAFPAHLVTSRPEDRAVGTAHWVQFTVPAEGRRLLSAFDRPAHFAFDNGTYQDQSGPLNDELRQSLVEDLELSERDAPRQAG